MNKLVTQNQILIHQTVHTEQFFIQKIGYLQTPDSYTIEKTLVFQSDLIVHTMIIQWTNLLCQLPAISKY